MSKAIIATVLLAGVLFGSNYGYDGSTTAAVTIAGAIIKTQNSPEAESKYKRRECPVCKGKGYYKSGDGLADVPCGYCEPDKDNSLEPPELDEESAVVHPPIIIKLEPKQPKTQPKTRIIYR